MNLSNISWVWRYWRAGNPDVLQSMGSQIARHDLVTKQWQTVSFIMRLLGYAILRGQEEGRHLFKRLQNLLDSIRPHLSTLLIFSFISRVLGRLPRYLKWPGEGAQEKHKHLVFSCLLINLYYIHYSDNKQKIKTKQIQTKIPSPTIISQKPTHVSYFSLKNDVPDVGLNIYKHYINNLPRSLRTHHWELRNHWIRQNFPLALDRISSWNYRKL